jgi:hypothetical protein
VHNLPVSYKKSTALSQGKAIESIKHHLAFSAIILAYIIGIFIAFLTHLPVHLVGKPS